jgi:hypothetical protein
LLTLVARRQAELWKDWRPWLALASLVIPLGPLLSWSARNLAETSAVYSWMYVNNWTMTYLQNPGFRMDLLQDVMSFLVEYGALIFWSWTVGFVLGSLSRGAAWINGAAFCLLVLGELAAVRPHQCGANAAAFALGFYRVVLPVILRIALVVIPSAWGMRQGARRGALSIRQTMLWAGVLISLTAWRHLPLHWGPRMLWLIALAWPVAYMIGATGWKRWHDA